MRLVNTVLAIGSFFKADFIGGSKRLEGKGCAACVAQKRLGEGVFMQIMRFGVHN